MTRTLGQAVASLKQQFPPGDADLYAWGNPKAWTARDLSLKARVLLAMQIAVDLLRVELVPDRCTEMLPDWEAVLGLSKSKLAVGGSTLVRRIQIRTRWRERGSPNRTRVAAALQPNVGYAPVILETDRDALTARNTYDLMGHGDPIPAGPGVTTWTRTIGENAPVSRAGFRFAYSIAHPSPSDLTIELQMPGQPFADVTSVIVIDGTSRIWFGGPAHHPDHPDPIDGVWSVRVTNGGANPGVIDWFQLIAEGWANKQIAVELTISVKTVEKILRRSP